MTEVGELPPLESRVKEQVPTIAAEHEGVNPVEYNGIPTEEEEEPPTIDIIINNVVCSFNTRCHLNLRQIAMDSSHVEYRREQSVCLIFLNVTTLQ